MQYSQEITTHYMNYFRDSTWSDPLAIGLPEPEMVSKYLSEAVCPSLDDGYKTFGAKTFIKAIRWVGNEGYKQEAIFSDAQYFGRMNQLQALHVLRINDAPILQVFPYLAEELSYDWPSIQLFHENHKYALPHLYEYEQAVCQMRQTEQFALEYFALSLAHDSCALLWISSLPEEAFGSWEELTDLFI